MDLTSHKCYWNRNTKFYAVSLDCSHRFACSTQPQARDKTTEALHGHSGSLLYACIFLQYHRRLLIHLGNMTHPEKAILMSVDRVYICYPGEAATTTTAIVTVSELMASTVSNLYISARYNADLMLDKRLHRPVTLCAVAGVGGGLRLLVVSRLSRSRGLGQRRPWL